MSAEVQMLVEQLTQRGLLELVDATAAEYFVSRDALLGRSRLKAVVAARRALCRSLRHLGMSYPDIGALIDRDHTTVMNLVRNEGRSGPPVVMPSIHPARAVCAPCVARLAPAAAEAG